MTDRLRLFPLRTVLFPSQTIPLVVFEPRYRQLVRECLDEGEPFGIILIREGVEVGGPAVPHPVGTTARIRDVSRLPDGRLQVEAVGERRFRILALFDDRPYLSAEVEYPVDDPSEPSSEQLEEARGRYRQVVRLQDVAAGEFQREIVAPATPRGLADAVGALGLGAPLERQRLRESMDGQRQVRAANELLGQRRGMRALLASTEYLPYAGYTWRTRT
jgi:Lon protease-like protein